MVKGCHKGIQRTHNHGPSEIKLCVQLCYLKRYQLSTMSNREHLCIYVYIYIYGLLNDAHNSYKKKTENDGNNKNQAQKILRHYIQLNSLSNKKSQFS